MISTPFWHMGGEEFWELRSPNYAVVTKETFVGSYYSVRNLREQGVYGVMNEELWDAMCSVERRAELVSVCVGQLCEKLLE